MNVEDISLLNKFAVAHTYMAGSVVGHECFVTEEMYADHLGRVKNTIARRIIDAFEEHPSSKYLKLPDKCEFEIIKLSKKSAFDSKYDYIIYGYGTLTFKD